MQNRESTCPSARSVAKAARTTLQIACVEALSTPGKVEVSWAAAPGTLAPGKVGTEVVTALRAVCVGADGSRLRL